MKITRINRGNENTDTIRRKVRRSDFKITEKTFYLLVNSSMSMSSIKE
jgi:hypothetical protein